MDPLTVSDGDLLKCRQYFTPDNINISIGHGRIASLNREHIGWNDEIFDTDIVYHFNALAYAVGNNHLDLAKWFLDHGAEQNAIRHRHEVVPLMFVASKYGFIEMAQLLCEYGASVTDHFNHIRTPLYVACVEDQLLMAQWLNKVGAPIVSTDNSNPIYLSMNVDVCEWLFAHGVEDEDYEYSSLFNAACFGSVEKTKWLIQKGASIRDQELQGTSLLMEACVFNNLNMAKFLFENGSDNVHVRDRRGYNIMSHVCWKGYLCVAMWLHSVGGDIHDKSQGRSPIILACLGGNLDVVQWLYRNGADPNEHDQDGATCVHHACGSGNLELVQWLVSVGGNIVGEDVMGRTPFWVTCFNLDQFLSYSTYVDIAKWLTLMGAFDVTFSSVRTCRALTEAFRLILDDHALYTQFLLVVGRSQLQGNDLALTLIAEFAGVVHGRPFRRVAEALSILTH